MPDLQGSVGELRFSIEIKRKETGVVEHYDMVGYLDEDKLKELTNGSHTLDSSTQRSN